MTCENIVAMQLEKQFLIRNIFPKYPKIAVKIKEKSERRYINNVRKVLLNERQKHILDVNHQNSYKQINIVDKPENQVEQHEFTGTKAFTKLNEEKSFLKTPKGSINGSQSVSNNYHGGKSSQPTTKHQNLPTEGSSNEMTNSGHYFKSNFLSKTSSADFIQQKSSKSEMPINETDINIILRRRLEGIENQMSDFSQTVYDFAVLADQGISNLTNNMGKL